MDRPDVELVPVFDLYRGQIVHAKGGNRSEYQPLVSRYSNGQGPFELITQIVSDYLPEQIYVADLDGIIHSQYAWDFYTKLIRLPCSIWIDLGIQQAQQVRRLLDLGCNVILGLESLTSPAHLQELVKEFISEGSRIRFSLDLVQLQPKANPAWPNDPIVIAEQVFATGLRNLLVLDLTQVGISQGISTHLLCQRMKALHPEWDIWTGGGICTWQDLQQLSQYGVSAGLVASSIHNGTMLPFSGI